SVSAWASKTSERWRIRARLMELGIEIVTAHALTAFDGQRATLECAYSGTPCTLEVGAAVLVGARAPNDSLYHDVLALCGGDTSQLPFTLTRLGDCEAPAIVAAAVYAGHRFAREFDAAIDIDQPARRDALGAAELVAPGKPSYLETLLQYYEEEVAGEAYFAALADRLTIQEQAEKMRLLAEVERHCAAIVAPLLQKYGLTPADTDTLVSEGRADAARGPQDYDAMIAYMHRTFPGYIGDFLRLERMAPPEDRAVLARMTDHEFAAVEFLDQEIAGRQGSTEPLASFLSRPAAA
ncbi:MAG: hypothetical protein AAF499_13305, partial [Pseudomonadota bacterium]